MRSINWGRVILGGLVAGVIINISEGLLNAKVLKDDWAAVMKTIRMSRKRMRRNYNTRRQYSWENPRS